MENFAATEPYTLWHYSEGHSQLSLRRVCDPSVLEPGRENIEILFLGVFYLELTTAALSNLTITTATPEEQAYVQERSERRFHEGDHYWALTSSQKRYFIGSGPFHVISKALPYWQWFDGTNLANQTI